jgi:hypothetical protein
MLAQRHHARRAEPFERVMHGGVREPLVIEVRDEVDRTNDRDRYARAGWTTTAGSPARRASTHPTIVAPGHAVVARCASASGTTSV